MDSIINYSKNLFDKDLSELTLEDIQNFFNSERIESDVLEFKSYPPFQKDDTHDKRLSAVKRSICGFLNSEGGILIWGAPVEKLRKGEKDLYQGELTPIPKKIDKDAFINSVSDSIFPTPAKIQFQTIEKEGKFLYVIQVQRSSFAPHQFQDKYFMRLDGHTRPAPHRYIEALFNKTSIPRLEAYLLFDRLSPTNKLGGGHKIDVKVVIFNTSQVNEKEVYYRLNTNFGQIYDRLCIQNSNFDYSDHNVKPILFYGEHIMIEHCIVFTNSYLTDYHIYGFAPEICFTLDVGGLYSPLIRSSYKFDFNKATEKYIDDIVKEENVFVTEIVDSDKNINWIERTLYNYRGY